MTLTSKQRSFLKKEAHELKPVVRIGKEGLTDNIAKNLEMALEANELIKVKVLKNSEIDEKELREKAEKLAKESNSDLVEMIGKTLIYYKESQKKPSISRKVKKIK